MSTVRRIERIEKVPARSGWIVANPSVTSQVVSSFRISGENQIRWRGRQRAAAIPAVQVWGYSRRRGGM